MPRSVITLCGSSRFKEEFEEANRRLTLAGWVVLSLGVFAKSSGLVVTPRTKEILEEIHRQKIEMADEIYVIDPGGYIGESTQAEIEYAISLDKPVRYYSKRIVWSA